MPDFKNCSECLLNLSESHVQGFSVLTGKTMYRLMVKLLNKGKLSGRVDTLWRAHLFLSDEVKPVCGALYKPPLTKRVGDLQWRVLHGAVVVSAFVFVVNPNVNDSCPFCTTRETVFF